MCEPPLPAHVWHPAVSLNLSTTPRVKCTCRCGCTAGSKLSFGSDGVQTTSCCLAYASLCAPACRPAGVPKVGSSVDDILPIQRFFSHLMGSFWFRPSTWNRTASHSSAIAPPYSRPPRFLYGVNPFSKMVSSSGTPAAVPHTALHEWRARTQSMSFGNVSQSTPPTFAANPAPIGARSPQAVRTWSHVVACLSRQLPVSPVSMQ